MSHEEADFPPAEVEPFPLTAKLLHIIFQLLTLTLPMIMSGLELQVRDAWIADIQAVTQHPDDTENWVCLLAFWICVLPLYQPTCARERRASTRALFERKQVEQLLQIWCEPGGVFRLLTRVMGQVPLPVEGCCRPSTHDRQVGRSRMLASLGRYRDAVAALSQSSCTVPFDSSFAQLQHLHPTAPSMPPLPSFMPLTPTGTDVARAISSFPRSSAGGRDGMRPQFLQDMLLHTAARLRDRPYDILADFVRIMLKSQMSPDLCPFVASAGLVGNPKPAGGIRPIAVGLTLRRLVVKVALYLLSKDTTAYLQP